MNEILITKEGYWFTNGETIAKEVHIGRYDSVDNWREISNEEKERIEAEREAEIDE